MAKITAADLQQLTAAELETLQLQVNAEVAVRIQNERLETRLVTALTDAQGVGFTDAQIDAAFTKSRDRVKKGQQDPARIKQPRAADPAKMAKDISPTAPTAADIKKQQTPAT